MSEKIRLLDAQQVKQRLTRLAYEIVERNLDRGQVDLVGVVDRGLVMAKLLKQEIETIGGVEVGLYALHIDKAYPVDPRIEPALDPKGRNLILVDDVANSGRTLTYALAPLLKAPADRIQVAVLIDRQHKQFPVASDYAGLQLSTTAQDHITVDVSKGKISGAFIE